MSVPVGGSHTIAAAVMGQDPCENLIVIVRIWSFGGATKAGIDVSDTGFHRYWSTAYENVGNFGVKELNWRWAVHRAVREQTNKGSSEFMPG